MSTAITIRPLVEADIPNFAKLVTTSFADSNDTAHNLMYPAGMTPALVAFYTTKGVADLRAAPPTKFFLGAFGPDATGAEAMLAVAVWMLIDDAAPTAVTILDSASPPPDAHVEAFASLHEDAEKARVRIMGATQGPYWTLPLIATAAAYWRRGAATALLKWGLDRADAEGRLAYLDATPMGRPLYEKLGFRCVHTLTLDGGRWGMDRVGHWCSMVRQAGGKGEPDGQAGE